MHVPRQAKRLSLRLRPVVGLVVLLGGGALVLWAASSGGPEAEALPDLRQAEPYGVISTAARDGRILLAFGSRIENVGGGPLVIEAERGSTSQPLMRANQHVIDPDGETRVVEDIGTVRYVRSRDHSHWHLLRFDRYELRTPDGAAVGRDRKTGFCLGDRYRVEAPPPGSPAAPAWGENCGERSSDRLQVEEGISVGYGDDYPAGLEGQHIDITGLGPGEYVLVHEVNGDRAIEESDYENNVASVLIRIAPPREGGAAPLVRVIGSCGEDARC